MLYSELYCARLAQGHLDRLLEIHGPPMVVFKINCEMETRVVDENEVIAFARHDSLLPCRCTDCSHGRHALKGHHCVNREFLNAILRSVAA